MDCHFTYLEVQLGHLCEGRAMDHSVLQPVMVLYEPIQLQMRWYRNETLPTTPSVALQLKDWKMLKQTPNRKKMRCPYSKYWRYMLGTCGSAISGLWKSQINIQGRCELSYYYNIVGWKRRSL